MPAKGVALHFLGTAAEGGREDGRISEEQAGACGGLQYLCWELVIQGTQGEGAQQVLKRKRPVSPLGVGALQKWELAWTRWP